MVVAIAAGDSGATVIESKLLAHFAHKMLVQKLKNQLEEEDLSKFEVSFVLVTSG